MKTTILSSFAAAAVAAVCLPQLANAQTPAPASSASSRPAFGVAIKASTFGYGVDAALRVHDKVNVRGTVNFLSLSHDFDDTDSNITYVGKLSFHSLAATVDWFPFGSGFHVSPTFVLNNGNKVTLSSLIPAGKTIDIDDVTYQSSSSNPIKAAGEVTFKNARPGVVIGWGNIAGGRRVTVPFELGVVFGGAPAGKLSFTGTACQSNGQNCRDMATDATIQTHVRAAEVDLNDTIKILRFYPVLSLGIGFRF
ncbi:MAG: hypothetical protein EPO35_02205 [Acidobacteria bacterium]|nr:MAG: hypothetical protein EPO35_02205 [Acidobacteriota bacterium]